MIRFGHCCRVLFESVDFRLIAIKLNFLLYSLYYAEECNKLAGLVSASLRAGSTGLFEEISQRWQAIGSNVLDLTDPRFEPQTSRSRDERVIARPAGRLKILILYQI